LAPRTFIPLFFILVATGNSVAQKALDPKDIFKLLPNKIKGFHDDGDSKSSLIKLGDLRYSLSERRFAKGKQKIKFLIFDYKEASIMYKQAMRKLNNESIVTDSLILRSITMDNCTGWESYNYQSYSSQIFLGICDRFFMMISAENVPLDQLRQTLNAFSFKDFPK
jgi:hypothetical protein